MHRNHHSTPYVHYIPCLNVELIHYQPTVPTKPNEFLTSAPYQPPSSLLQKKEKKEKELFRMIGYPNAPRKNDWIYDRE